jgi:uncharacterized protein (AIM24 family)
MPDRDLAMKWRRRWIARLYKYASVKMTANVQSLSTGLSGSMNFIANCFTGPGRVGVQCMYLHTPTTE